MGNEVAIGCRSCLVLTMARFPTAAYAQPQNGFMLCLGVGGGTRQGDRSDADPASVFTGFSES